MVPSNMGQDAGASADAQMHDDNQNGVPVDPGSVPIPQSKPTPSAPAKAAPRAARPNPSQAPMSGYSNAARQQMDNLVAGTSPQQSGQDVADQLTKLYNPTVKFAKGGAVSKPKATGRPSKAREMPKKKAAGGDITGGPATIAPAKTTHTRKPEMKPKMSNVAPKFAKGGDVKKMADFFDAKPGKLDMSKGLSNVGTGEQAGIKNKPKSGSGAKNDGSLKKDQSKVGGSGSSVGIKDAAKKDKKAKMNLDMGKGVSNIGGSGSSVGLKDAGKKGSK
jgi:hypothetical protein